MLVLFASLGVSRVVGGIAKLGSPAAKGVDKILTVVGSAVLSGFASSVTADYVGEQFDCTVVRIERLGKAVSKLKKKEEEEDTMET